MQTKNKRTTGSNDSVVRPIDRYFSEFSTISKDSLNRVMQYLFLPVFSFAVLGLIWMIPFPEIAFLKERGYHIFLNWGSFFIAAVIYYYLRLAPTLSYMVLIFIGLMSYFIVQLEYVEASGGPAVTLVCTTLLLMSFLALWLGHRRENGNDHLVTFFKLLAHGPLWLLHFVFKRFKLPY